MTTTYLRMATILLVACGGNSGDTTKVDAPAGDSQDGGDTDAAPANVLPLGTVTIGPMIACPTGASPGAACNRFMVACPQIPNASGIISVASPASPVGTVVMIFGGSGQQFFDEGFPAAYLAGGLRVVQMRFDAATFDAGWTSAGGQGVKPAACRPATVIRWAFDNVHGQSRAQGFCAHGHSGGSGAVSYAIAHYGLADVLDFVMVDAGPVFGRIDYGCEPSLAGTGGTTRSVCPEIPAGPFDYNGRATTILDTAEGTTTCGTPYGDSSAVERADWENDSVVSVGATYDYPNTKLGFWYCGNNPNEASGQGSFFAERVTSSKTITCVTGQCQVEPAWTDPAAKQAMMDTMTAECIPRHP